MSGVKRYNLRQNMPATATTFLPDVVVSASDYDRDIQALKAERNAQLVGVCLERDTLRTANQRLEGEVASLKADAARYQFLKENCQQDVDGYRNETPILVHALSHIPEWRNRIDEAIDAALAGDGGE